MLSFFFNNQQEYNKNMYLRYVPIFCIFLKALYFISASVDTEKETEMNVFFKKQPYLAKMNEKIYNLNVVVTNLCFHSNGFINVLAKEYKISETDIENMNKIIPHIQYDKFFNKMMIENRKVIQFKFLCLEISSNIFFFAIASLDNKNLNMNQQLQYENEIDLIFLGQTIKLKYSVAFSVKDKAVPLFYGAISRKELVRAIFSWLNREKLLNNSLIYIHNFQLLMDFIEKILIGFNEPDSNKDFIILEFHTLKDPKFLRAKKKEFLSDEYLRNFYESSLKFIMEEVFERNKIFSKSNDKNLPSVLKKLNYSKYLESLDDISKSILDVFHSYFDLKQKNYIDPYKIPSSTYPGVVAEKIFYFNVTVLSMCRLMSVNLIWNIYFLSHEKFSVVYKFYEFSNLTDKYLNDMAMLLDFIYFMLEFERKINYLNQLLIFGYGDCHLKSPKDYRLKLDVVENITGGSSQDHIFEVIEFLRKQFRIYLKNRQSFTEINEDTHVDNCKDHLMNKCPLFKSAHQIKNTVCSFKYIFGSIFSTLEMLLINNEKMRTEKPYLLIFTPFIIQIHSSKSKIFQNLQIIFTRIIELKAIVRKTFITSESGYTNIFFQNILLSNLEELIKTLEINFPIMKQALYEIYTEYYVKELKNTELNDMYKYGGLYCLVLQEITDYLKYITIICYYIKNKKQVDLLVKEDVFITKIVINFLKIAQQMVYILKNFLFGKPEILYSNHEHMFQLIWEFYKIDFNEVRLRILDYLL